MKKNKGYIISEIAGELNCGNNCYLNPKTGELITIPDFLNSTFDTELEEVFQNDIEKVRANDDDFISFEVLKSFESYKIMRDFVEQLGDGYLKIHLTEILSKSRPFRHFKYAIDRSDFREDWFRFKDEAMKNIVRKRLENEIENQD